MSSAEVEGFHPNSPIYAAHGTFQEDLGWWLVTIWSLHPLGTPARRGTSAPTTTNRWRAASHEPATNTTTRNSQTEAPPRLPLLTARPGRRTNPHTVWCLIPETKSNLQPGRCQYGERHGRTAPPDQLPAVLCNVATRKGATRVARRDY